MSDAFETDAATVAKALQVDGHKPLEPGKNGFRVRPGQGGAVIVSYVDSTPEGARGAENLAAADRAITGYAKTLKDWAYRVQVFARPVSDGVLGHYLEVRG